MFFPPPRGVAAAFPDRSVVPLPAAQGIARDLETRDAVFRLNISAAWATEQNRIFCRSKSGRIMA
jgi:hypothetical protein